MNSLLPPGSSALGAGWRRPVLESAILNVPRVTCGIRGNARQSFCPIWLGVFCGPLGARTETAKRQAVSDAFWIHQRKGTVAAVKRVIEGLGYTMTIEWWEVADPPGRFGEIDLYWHH